MHYNHDHVGTHIHIAQHFFGFYLLLPIGHNESSRLERYKKRRACARSLGVARRSLNNLRKCQFQNVCVNHCSNVHVLQCKDRMSIGEWGGMRSAWVTGECLIEAPPPGK